MIVNATVNNWIKLGLLMDSSRLDANRIKNI